MWKYCDKEWCPWHMKRPHSLNKEGLPLLQNADIEGKTKKIEVTKVQESIREVHQTEREDEVATSPDGKESMDIGSDDASNDVVECSDGKEATGSDKEIKGVKIEDNPSTNLESSENSNAPNGEESEDTENSGSDTRPVTAPAAATTKTEQEEEEDETPREEQREKSRPKTAPAPVQEKKIPMDPMRALACLEFVSARGLETSDTGPKILANHFGMKMTKLEKKRAELLSEMEKRRRAKLPLDGIRGEFFKIWNDNCQAHEAYQFFRKKNADKYAGNIPPPAHLSKAEMKRKK